MYKDYIEFLYKDKTFNIYYQYNQVGKPPILFLHGLGDDSLSFLDVFNYKFSNDYSIYLIDFPCHGNSKYILGITIGDLVEVVNLFTFKLGLKDIVLVGHSMGGLVGLIYSGYYYGNIKKFINIEGNLDISDCGFSIYICNMGNKEFEEKFGSFYALYDYACLLVEYSYNNDLLSYFQGLNIPKYFVYGKNSKIEYIYKLENTFAIPNSGHHPFSENKDYFYQKLEDILKL